MSTEFHHAHPPRSRALAKTLACLAVALFAALPQWASAFACGDAPSAYFDGNGGFESFNDPSGYPVFNKNHCYGNPIFSTTGRDTYTSNPYGNRVMTNSGFGYQCFELAERYFLFKYNKRIRGEAAADMCGNALPSGVKRLFPGSGMPVPGDLFVFGRGSCGASPQWGHIAVITKVWNSGSVQIAQQNMRSEKYTIANVKSSCACAYLHATDNLAANGPPVDTPADAWEPGRDGGEDGPEQTNGGNLIDDPGNTCHCTSSDPLSVWPMCCKKK
ncbi:MAG TPA: CHAP domain-containing protein [Albitalea sp.]|nr:CHAP domain-containing protein [Albitalea sp.]